MFGKSRLTRIGLATRHDAIVALLPFHSSIDLSQSFYSFFKYIFIYTLIVILHPKIRQITDGPWNVRVYTMLLLSVEKISSENSVTRFLKISIDFTQLQNFDKFPS